MEPGLYADMSNEDYHAEHEWLSSSTLKRALPERYAPGGSQAALDFGTLFHTAALEPDKLAAYTVLDAARIGVKSDGTPAAVPTMTVAWKRAVAEAEQAGQVVVAQEDWDRAQAMVAALRAHPEATRLLSGDGIAEESAFWIDDAGVKHRARADWRKPGVIVDLKSTSEKPGARNLRGAMYRYGYHLSAAHYLNVYEGLGCDVQAFALVFVGKEAPHYVTVAEVGPDRLDEGHEQRAEAIARITDPTADAYEGASGFITL